MNDTADGTIDILLVEDNPDHAGLIERAFKERGGDVRLATAATLAEAREFLAAHVVSPPRLIIADWRLPDGVGIDIMPAIHGECPAPVIVMTSYGNERIAVDAMKAGAIDYVVKSSATLIDMPHVAERALREWTAQRERARIADALRASEEGLRTIVANVPIVLFSTDRAGVYTLVEGKGLDLLRMNHDEVVGRSCFDVWRDVPEALRCLRAALAGQRAKCEIAIGETVFEAHFSPVRDERADVAGAIGVAIDVTERELAALRLMQASQELQEAYDATLVGWSRALELREHETAGHSQRVVDLTLRFARAVGIDEAALVHVHRGALLHDIGKMAIPDHILLKPDPLSPDELVIMRQHSQFAYEMLKDIPYLQPALDIPYCHHERWDGTGYPRGLRGEEIPLAARVFAIADVWDALTSHRPYRPAWREQDACQHLRDNAGKQFDPDLIARLLGLICPVSSAPAGV